MVPSFQEAPRCTVCNTPFSTFKRRVSTQKSTPCTISRSERERETNTHTHTHTYRSEISFWCVWGSDRKREGRGNFTKFLFVWSEVEYCLVCKSILIFFFTKFLLVAGRNASSCNASFHFFKLLTMAFWCFSFELRNAYIICFYLHINVFSKFKRIFILGFFMFEEGVQCLFDLNVKVFFF